MSCMCQCSYDDGYGPSFFVVKNRTARKEYKCYECGREIHKKDKYVHIVGKWDYIDNFRVCPTCNEISEKLFCNHNTIGLLWEELAISVDENIISWSDIGSLSATAREAVCNFIHERWKNDGLDDD